MFVHGQHFVEDFHRSVERETQVADPAGFTFLDQIIEHAVLDIAGTEGFDTAVSDRVQQIIVDIIGLQVLERLLVHGNGVLARPVLEVRQLRSDEELLTRMALQGNTGRLLRPALHIYR